MKKLRKMKKNNKGFSLVELIVVIAIMVVLVAVLGSTILGYIDEAKYSKDIQALDSIDTVMMLLVADPNSKLDAVTWVTGKDDNFCGTLTDLYNATETGKNISNKKVIENTLGETFTKNADGNKLIFNGESDAFKNLTSDYVYIQIKDGKVYITVDSQASDEGEYPDYVSPSANGKDLCGEVTFPALT